MGKCPLYVYTCDDNLTPGCYGTCCYHISFNGPQANMLFI